MAPFGLTVEVLGGTRDLDGDLQGEQVVGTIVGAGFAPGTSIEDNDRKAQVVTTGTLYVPADAMQVTAQHRIRFPGGVVWSVDGAPGDWNSPLTGWQAGREIRLRRATG